MKEYAGLGRSLRAKRKTYIDGMSSSDEETENIERTLDPEDIIKSKTYPAYFVKEMLGDEVTLEHFQKTGLKNPILVKEKSGLHMKIPDTTFTITDVRNLVGGKRILEVMNCATQSNAEMTLKDWEEFFTAPDRDDTKLNVISLEFSHTKLDSYVVAPRVVRQVDFTDNIWPRHLKEMQEDTTNDMARMLYPKVQKYCLMSIAGCYTDFHVDLGGTSVWYHILRGKKVFWLIPPTPANLKAFEHWTMSGKQSDVFFGDLVERCGRVVLEPGNTFFIPSGWIHAVYTPIDSLVFGGNYLHPYAIERQLRVAQLEETLKVPHKYRFPFYTEMMWWVLDRYCYHLLGRHHMAMDESVITKLLGNESERKTFQENIGHPYVTPEEVRGLKSIVLYLHSLPGNKKNVPPLLKDPVLLVRDIRIISEVHKSDTHEKGVTGRPLIFWPGVKNEASNWYFRSKKRKSVENVPAPRVVVDGVRHLNQGVQCEMCGLDGWWADTKLVNVERNVLGNCMLECGLCHTVTHPSCLPDVGVDGRVGEGGGEGSNWWTCPHCVLSPPKEKVKEEARPQEDDQQMELEKMGVKEEPIEVMEMSMENTPEKVKEHEKEVIKVEINEEGNLDVDLDKLRTETQAVKSIRDNLQQDHFQHHPQISEVKEQNKTSEPFEFNPLKEFQQQIPQFFQPPPSVTASVPLPLKEDIKEELPYYSQARSSPPQQTMSPYRPSMSLPRISSILETICLSSTRVRAALTLYSTGSALTQSELIMLPILQMLPTPQQATARMVCRSWHRIVSRFMSPNVSTDLTGHKVTPNLLSVIARHQPTSLLLGLTNTSKQQLVWLLPRLSNIRVLSLQGLDWVASVSALTSSNCPAITCLNLGSVTNMTDSSISSLFRPRDSKRSPLSSLRHLDLSNTDISDISLRYLAQYLPSLSSLNLHNCSKLTDAGLVQLGDPSLPLCTTVTSLIISSCPMLTDLIHLARCSNITRLSFTETGVTYEATMLFMSHMPNLFLYKEGVIAKHKMM